LSQAFQISERLQGHLRVFESYYAGRNQSSSLYRYLAKQQNTLKSLEAQKQKAQTHHEVQLENYGVYNLASVLDELPYELAKLRKSLKIEGKPVEENGLLNQLINEPESLTTYFRKQVRTLRNYIYLLDEAQKLREQGSIWVSLPDEWVVRRKEKDHLSKIEQWKKQVETAAKGLQIDLSKQCLRRGLLGVERKLYRQQTPLDKSLRNLGYILNLLKPIQALPVIPQVLERSNLNQEQIEAYAVYFETVIKFFSFLTQSSPNDKAKEQFVNSVHEITNLQSDLLGAVQSNSAGFKGQQRDLLPGANRTTAAKPKS
jgi:hypothetical protein